MFTVIETNTFIRTTDGIWSNDEREAFIHWIAANPTAGDLIAGTGGLRKVRWARRSMGKRGGTRVITYTVLGSGEVWLLVAYTKSKFDTLPTSFLNALKSEMDRG